MRVAHRHHPAVVVVWSPAVATQLAGIRGLAFGPLDGGCNRSYEVMGAALCLAVTVHSPIQAELAIFLLDPEPGEADAADHVDLPNAF